MLTTFKRLVASEFMVRRRAMECEVRTAKLVLAKVTANLDPVTAVVVKFLDPGLPKDFPCMDTELGDFMKPKISQVTDSCDYGCDT